MVSLEDAATDAEAEADLGEQSTWTILLRNSQNRPK